MKVVIFENHNLFENQIRLTLLKIRYKFEKL